MLPRRTGLHWVRMASSTPTLSPLRLARIPLLLGLLVSSGLRAAPKISPARIAYAQGALAFDNRRYTEAARHFDRAGKLGFSRDLIYFRLAACAMHLGAYEKARKYYAKTLEMGHEVEESRIQHARAQYQLGHDKSALESLSELSPTSRAEPRVHLLRGKLLVRQQRFDEAYEELRQVAGRYAGQVFRLAEKFPEPRNLALQELARVESEKAKLKKKEAPPAEPEMTELDRLRATIPAMTRIASPSASRKKTGGKMRSKYGKDSVRSGPSGPAVIESREIQGSGSMN